LNLDFLGIRLDGGRNEAGSGDRIISPDGAPVAVLALAANEELIVARRAYAVLAEKGG
jgi:acetate kinase